MNYRYNEKDEAPTLRIQRTDRVKFGRGNFSLAQVALSAHCIEYQSCECDDYRASQTYEILRDIYDRVSFAMADADAYATWGIK